MNCEIDYQSHAQTEFDISEINLLDESNNNKMTKIKKKSDLRKCLFNIKTTDKY